MNRKRKNHVAKVSIYLNVTKRLLVSKAPRIMAALQQPTPTDRQDALCGPVGGLKYCTIK